MTTAAESEDVEDILKHADELAKRFEDYQPTAEDERDPEAVNMLRQAVAARSDAERSIRDAVGVCGTRRDATPHADARPPIVGGVPADRGGSRTAR